jgi:hypothetical protein
VARDKLLLMSLDLQDFPPPLRMSDRGAALIHYDTAEVLKSLCLIVLPI